MNMSPRLTPILTYAGIETVARSSLGAANELDPKIMAYAVAHDYVVLINDLDFGLLLSATNASTPSVVQVRLDNLDPEIIGRRMVEVLRGLGAELEAGALVTVDPKKTRVRVLPLRARGCGWELWRGNEGNSVVSVHFTPACGSVEPTHAAKSAT